jgi:hypothetical protein
MIQQAYKFRRLEAPAHLLIWERGGDAFRCGTHFCQQHIIVVKIK